MNRSIQGPTDPTTPCDKCGGGTYTFPSGSIWCPDEDAHPGGYFVKRVAFERPPNRDHVERPAFSRTPAARTPAPVTRRASSPTSRVTKTKVDEGFAPSLHDFVETK